MHLSYYLLRVALLTLLVITSSRAFAQTDVQGTIDTDSTWTTSGSPYVVTADLTVAAAGRLTIEPGVEVQFDGGRQMIVYGELYAQGATFTSSAAAPASGDWRRIYVASGGGGTGWAELVDCVIEYGGAFNNYTLDLRGGYASMTGGSLGNSAYGIYGGGDSLRVEGTGIFNIGSTAVFAQTDVALTDVDISTSRLGIDGRAGTLALDGVSIAGMSDDGIEMRYMTASFKDVVISGTVWPIWLHDSAELSFEGTNDFTGNDHDAVYVGFSRTNRDFRMPTLDVPYHVAQVLRVDANTTLTIETGNILKFGSYDGIDVYGTLVAEADTLETIDFSAYTDDDLGGDTNDDGDQTSPASQYWRGVRFYEDSDDANSVIRRARFFFAGAGRIGAVSLYDAGPTIDQSSFTTSYYGVLMGGTSSPVFTRNTIGTSDVVPIAMNFAASPVFENNVFSFSDNQFDAIGLLGGDLPADAVLPQRDVTDIPNVTYYMLEHLTIPQGRSLTIEPGVVIKADGSKRIDVEGLLVADADELDPIVFTSVKDDNYGNPGDTNKDGTQSTPQVTDWGGIAFFPDSDDASVIDHAILQYAARHNFRYADQYYNDRAAITVAASSPTISNTTIRNANIGVVFVGDAQSQVSNNTFANTASVPVALSFAANPTFSNTTLVNASMVALGIVGESLGLSGTLRKRDFAGFTNITYVQLGDVTIRPAATVSIDPGIVVKYAGDYSIYVDGGFRTLGDEVDGPVIFTSLKDDNRGNPGDTNGDGNATSASAGEWGAIHYRGTSDDAFSTFGGAEVRYGLIGLVVTDAAPTVRDVLISDASHWGLVSDGAATPVVEDVAIQNCGQDPLMISLLADPQYSGVTFASNASNGIALVEGTSTSYWRVSRYFSNDNTLSSDATLRRRSVAGIDNIGYVFSRRLLVAPDAQLIVMPGVVVKGTSSAYFEVEGSLVADATMAGDASGEDRIVFTSIRDDSAGGDTNNDGNESTPGRSDWYGIRFMQSADDADNRLMGVDLRYARGQSSAVVEVHNAFAHIEDCVIEQAYYSGIGIFGSADPLIRNNQILNVGSTPVRMNLFANPTFEDNTALNVGSMAIGVEGETYSTTATVPIRSFAGYDNITYHLLNPPQTVNTSTVITIPEGVVFKALSGSPGFRVRGALRIEGTADAPVVFTDLHDDAFGNPADTEQDGNTTQPSFGFGGYRWLEFEGVSDDALSLVDHAVLRYRRYGVVLESASPTITNTLFEHGEWGISLEGVSEPVVEDNTFSEMRWAPLLISLVSYPASTSGNVIEGSTYEAIGVRTETLVQDVTLGLHTFAGRENIPYYFSGTYTVGTGATLTIDPGVVMKFASNAMLAVNKGLVAEGGPEAENVIVFTHETDDFYGGDVNRDSTETKPWTNGLWNGIHFEGEALDPLSRLDHVVVRYAGSSSNYGAVNAEHASPTITNSVLAHNRSGVVARGSANPVINGSDIYANERYGVWNVDGSHVIDATGNWWGADSGPTHATNPGGTGDEVSDDVDFDPFVGGGAANPILGDVSLNGSVAAFDASLILQHVVGQTTLSATQLAVSDVSGESGTTAMDASYLLQYVVGQIDAFPAEAMGKDGRPVAFHAVSDVVLRLGDADGRYGELVTVPVFLQDVDDLIAVQLGLGYDADVLAVEAVTAGALAGDRQLLWREDDEGGMLRVALAGQAPVDEDGLLLEVTFRVAPDVRGDVTPELAVEHFLANEKDRSAAAVAGRLSIEGIPTAFKMLPNYPNPFTTQTTVAFHVPEDGVNVEIVIFNVLGQEVRTLVRSSMDAGRHQLVWDGRGDGGVPVGSGVYLARMTAGDFAATQRLMLLR